ncbi:MAG: redox-sensing transcriptional repressor Rex [Treponemataceae bacterium]
MTKSKLEFTPTYERLPSYLHLAEEALQEEKEFISGTEIAELQGSSSIQVRKDLAFAGLKGIPKRGYKTAEVVSGINEFLTWNEPKDAFLLGAGNLGRAIALHSEFAKAGLNIVAIFDKDKEKIGKKIGNLKILKIDLLEKKFDELKPSIAIFTLSYDANVQEIAELLAEKGIKGIWNFTKHNIDVSDEIAVYDTDLTSGYAVFCAEIKRRNE